jgi:anti-sigma B factor antagonist
MTHWHAAQATGGGVATFVVDGEIDISNARDFGTALLEHIEDPGTTQLVVDLSRVEFMDSSGLQALLGARRNATGRVDLVLLNPSSAIVRLLELTALTEMFAIQAS